MVRGRKVPRAGERSRHHLESVADAFLPPSPAPSASAAHPGVVVAAFGPAVEPSVPALILNHLGTGRGASDLGGDVGARLARWEREGLAASRLSARPLLFWCVQGTEATSLAATLALGRLAALVEPVGATVLWLPGRGARGGKGPDAAARARVVELAGCAAPRAAVTVHCVGWRREPAADLGALAARFA